MISMALIAAALGIWLLERAGAAGEFLKSLPDFEQILVTIEARIVSCTMTNQKFQNVYILLK